MWLQLCLIVLVQYALSDSLYSTDRVVSLDGFDIHGQLVDYGDNQPGSAQQFTYYGVRYGNQQRWKPATINSDYQYKSNASIPAKGHWCQWFVPYPLYPLSLLMADDCLYLDIYVPPISEELRLKKKFPVLFWVHGGALITGSKDEYSSADLARSLEAVVVTIQYRLGPLGFLTTGDGIIPANLGLQDAKLAWLWVQRNIEHFAGDPLKVTLAGESAGSVIITAMLLDADIRASVHSAISMSGSILAPFATRNSGFETASKLAQLLNCSTISSAEAAACMKQRSVEDIIKVANDPFFQTSSVFALPWTFAVDGIHIPFDPPAFLQTQKRKLPGGLLTGHLSEDSSLFMDYQSYWANMLGETQPNTTWIKTFVIKDFLKTTFNCLTDDPTTQMVEDVFKFFGFINQSNAERRKSIIKLVTMAFSLPSILEAQLYSEMGLAELGSQLYIISYVHDFKPVLLQNYPEVLKLLGAYHFTDVQYLFGPSIEGGTNLLTPHSNTSYTALTQQMRILWGQMVHHGSTSGKSFNVQQGDYLSLGADKTWKLANSKHFQKELNFFRRLKAWDCGKGSPESTVEPVTNPTECCCANGHGAILNVRPIAVLVAVVLSLLLAH